MKAVLSALLTVVYSFLSLFGLSFDGGSRIWTKNAVFNIETKSDIYIPDENVWVNGTQYPCIISLSDGALLASFEVFDKDDTGFIIMSGGRTGEAWTEISRVRETADDSVNASWNPCLFELPETVGKFEKGTVLLAGVSIDPAQSEKSRISVYASSDSGRSWSEISAVDEAGGTGDGVWEPFLAYEDGWIYCFYSDDSDAEKSQTIVYKRSRDCENWEEKIPAAVSENPDERPGMPVLTRMGNGKWFICYEWGDGSGYPVYYKTADSLNEWNCTDKGTPLISKGGRTAGSAPSCIWIPAGGKNGTLIVSGKYGNGKENDLFISSDYGESFRIMKNPLNYSDKQGFGYHASFCWSEEDNTLFYANTVDYTDTLSKIAFAGISVKSRFLK